MKKAVGYREKQAVGYRLKGLPTSFLPMALGLQPAAFSTFHSELFTVLQFSS